MAGATRRLMSPGASLRWLRAPACLLLAFGSAEARPTPAPDRGVTLVLSVRDSLTGRGVRGAELLIASYRQAAPTRILGIGGPWASLALAPGEQAAVVRAPGYRALALPPAFRGRDQARTPAFSDAQSTTTVWLDPASPALEFPLASVAGRRVAGAALLHGHVVDGVTLRPMARVKVRLQKAALTTVTDRRGYFWLNAPGARAAHGPDALPETDDLVFESRGYKAFRLANVALFETDTHFIVDMERGSGETGRDDGHKMLRLLGPLPPASGNGAASEEDATAPEAGRLPFSLDALAGGARVIDPPDSINVEGLGIFSLETYVGNGLNDEWIASWNQDALRAGAVAYRSYGSWYQINQGIICATASCQVYDTDSSSSTHLAAQLTAGILLEREGAVARSEYSAENNCSFCPSLSCANSDLSCGPGFAGSPAADWSCLSDAHGFAAGPGECCYGHGRGMCQWGTQAWAETGSRWAWMVNHYYNDMGNGTGLRTMFMTSPVSVVAASANPSSLPAGSSFTVSATGRNYAEQAHARILVRTRLAGAPGSVANGSGEAKVTLDARTDTVVSAPFALPPTASAGTYDLEVELWLDADEDDAVGDGDLRLEAQAFPQAVTITGGTGCPAPTVPPDRWRGEYWNNKDLAGGPSLVRDDGAGFLDFDWGTGSPGATCGIGADDFSASWTRAVSFAAGTYRFDTRTDDGVRLYVDDVLRIDKWVDRAAPASPDSVDVTLGAGSHTLRLEYYENGGLASAELAWAQVSGPSGGWAYPVGDADSGGGWSVTNPLGNSWYSDTNQRWYRGHLGEDWFKDGGGSYGETVYAAAAGKVMTLLNNCGNYVDVVIIEHQVDGFSEPVYSFYGHIEANGFVQEGDWVQRRQPIGTIADPVDFQPHLHFEIKDRTALIEGPLSNCSNVEEGIYISAGYSGLEDDYDGGEYYDPSDGIADNRFYHPSRFIEKHKDGTPTPGTDCANFVADLSYPDGKPVLPGESFDKGWRLANCGDTTWGDGYRAVRIGGGYGPVSFSFDAVAAGSTGDLWTSVIAPTTLGSHRATYRLEGPNGPFGDPFWVEVVVKPATDCATFVGDLNYPDGSPFPPGQRFDKGWALANCGNTTWGSGYRAVRVSGGYGLASFSFPAVAPGSPGSLWASFTAPATAGTHRATYRLEGPNGPFGDSFWVEIVVKPAPTTVVVDDGDSGFQLFGPPAYWHRASIGYGGDMYWTYVNGTVVSNNARWKPMLPGSGSYKVQVFVPWNHATSRAAKYKVRAGGSSHTASVDQSIYFDQWVTLGTFSFSGANDGTEYVELTDATGEPGSTYRKLGFDAVRWVKQ